MEFASGDVHEGGWRADLRHGAGVSSLRGGEVLEGRFERGALHGQGRHAAPVAGSSGRGLAVYEGEFAAGEKHGHGKMTMPNGNVYKGERFNK